METHEGEIAPDVQEVEIAPDDIGTIAERQTYRMRYINGLRVLANFLDRNPAIPIPEYSGVTVNVFLSGTNQREQLSSLARIIGGARKDAAGGYFWLEKSFGPHSLQINANRAQVCEKRVVGTEYVPSRFTPAHLEEKVEWVCPDSILSALGEGS